MNAEDFSRTDLIESLSPLLALGGLFLCAVLWLGSVILRSRVPRWTIAASVFGFLVAAAACWFAFQLLGAAFSLATSWSLPAIAIIGALAAEAIVWIYQFERTLVTKKRGRTLLALRLGALVILLL
ncbi:MAG: hypothetical protein ABL994_17490, partial [Verrucomicrobiales bacterium]